MRIRVRGKSVVSSAPCLIVELVVSRLTTWGKRGRPSRPGSFSRPIPSGTNRRRMGQVGLAAFPIIGAVAASALQGCDDRQVNRAKVPEFVQHQVPEFVQQMMDADFPADGRGHVRVRGKFRIDPTTAFCTFRPGYSLDAEQLNAALRQMGQNPYYEGGSRTHPANGSRYCIPGRSVFVRAVPTANRQGGPYKLILAVWQGDAAWTGAIERLNGTRPGFESARPFRDGMPPLTPWARRGFEREDRDHRAELSIRRDMVDLSQAALNRIVKDSE
jgi:hypothetical protein